MHIEASHGADGATVTVDGRRLTPATSLRYRRHSPTGFAWGYAGSGPAQLALALLLKAGVGKDVALALYQTFKIDIIAAQPFNRAWSLDLDVKAWAAAALRAREARAAARGSP